MKKIIIPIFIVTLLGAGVYAWRSIPRPNPFAQFPREKVQSGDFVLSIEEVGVIKARKSQMINAPFSGKITKILDDGTSVTNEQTVIWLDTEEVQKDLDEQITNLKSTRTDLERTIEELLKGLRNNSLKVEYAAAELEFARLKLLEVNRKLETVQLLVDRNIVAKTDVDSARQNVESEKYNALNTELNFKKDMKDKRAEESSQEAEIGKVKLRSIKAKKRIDEAREKIDEAEIKAPTDGLFLITERYDWQKGRNTKSQAGDQIWRGQALAEIPDLSSLIILSQVSEEEVASVHIGQEVKVTIDAFPDLGLRANVTRLGMVAIPRHASPAGGIVQGMEDTGQKVFELDLEIERADSRIKPGMTANISIILDTVKNALTLPLSTIYRKEGRAVVYMVTKGGYETRFVTLGRRNRERVEILSGIEPGSEIFKKDLGELDKET